MKKHEKDAHCTPVLLAGIEEHRLLGERDAEEIDHFPEERSALARRQQRPRR